MKKWLIWVLLALLWLGIALSNLMRSNIELLDILAAIFAIIASIANLYRAKKEYRSQWRKLG